VGDPDPAMATDSGGPVWFAGRTLARDLSLPKLQARWASAPAPPTPIRPAPTEHSVVGRAERTAAVSGAVAALDRATAAVAAGAAGHEVGEDLAGIAHSAADLTVALRAVLARTAVGEVAARVERLYDRAARQARVGQPRAWGPLAAQLRTAAWRLAAIRGLNDRLGGDAGIVPLIVAVTALIAEIAAHHEQRQCLAQARAARGAAAVWPLHRAGAAHAPTGAGHAAQIRPGPMTIPSAVRDGRLSRGTGTFLPPVIPGGGRSPGSTRGPRNKR
jgi:hypothetical protein